MDNLSIFINLSRYFVYMAFQASSVSFVSHYRSKNVKILANMHLSTNINLWWYWIANDMKSLNTESIRGYLYCIIPIFLIIGLCLCYSIVTLYYYLSCFGDVHISTLVLLSSTNLLIFPSFLHIYIYPFFVSFYIANKYNILHNIFKLKNSEKRE